MQILQTLFEWSGIKEYMYNFFPQCNLVLHCNFRPELNFILIIIKVLRNGSTMILFKQTQILFHFPLYIYIFEKC